MAKMQSEGPAGGEGRRERRKREVENRIRRAAETLLSEKSYEATTMEEIAAVADVSKATVFNYFPRKELLLRALAEEWVGPARAALGQTEGRVGTGLEGLRQMLQSLARIAEGNPALHRTLVRESMRTYWDRAERDEVEQEFRGLTRSLLARAKAEGELDQGVDIEIAASLLEAAYMTTIVEWLREGASPGVVGRALDAKIDVVFRGLGARGDGGRG